METETEKKEQQWKKSISSSSGSSSITSESSDGHFDIRHFPLPKPTLSASEAQKQRETHQSYNSSISSYTGSSWSSAHPSHLFDLPGYDPNRIPSSVFSSKPVSSAEWSIASNESLFSIHDGNFSISTKEDYGFAAALKSVEIPKFEERVQEITEINPVPLPPVKKPKESEKQTISKEKPFQVKLSNSEIGKNKHREEEHMIERKVLVEIEKENPEEKEIEEHVKENKPEDSNSITSHSPSLSCLSDISNNSFGSFVFPLLKKEDVVVKTPYMELRGNFSHKRKPEYQRPQSQMQPLETQTQPYSMSSTLTHLQPQSKPQRNAPKQFKSKMQLQKASRNGLFSCFHGSLKCGLFK